MNHWTKLLLVAAVAGGGVYFYQNRVVETGPALSPGERLASAVFGALKQTGSSTAWSSRVTWGACMTEDEWKAVRSLAGQDINWLTAGFEKLAGEWAHSSDPEVIGAEFVVRSGSNFNRMYMEYVPFAGGGYFVRDIFYGGRHGHFLIVDDDGSVRWKQGELFHIGGMETEDEPMPRVQGRLDPMWKVAATLRDKIMPTLDREAGEPLQLWVDRGAPVEVLNGVLEVAARDSVGIPRIRIATRGVSDTFEIETLVAAEAGLAAKTILTVTVDSPGFATPDPKSATAFCPNGKELRWAGRRLSYTVRSADDSRSFKELRQVHDHLKELGVEQELFVLDARAGTRFIDLMPMFGMLDRLGFDLVMLLGPVDTDFLLASEM
ncbi:MAG TPA: hypothetical protein VGC54_05105 [Planctomycetota bacterium]